MSEDVIKQYIADNWGGPTTHTLDDFTEGVLTLAEGYDRIAMDIALSTEADGVVQLGDGIEWEDAVSITDTDIVSVTLTADDFPLGALATMGDATELRVTLTEGEVASVTIKQSLSTHPPFPVFVSDYDMIHGQMQERDTIYVMESEMERTVRGIGYHAVDTSELYQLHLYGPDRNRGRKVRDKLEGILDERTLRMRYEGIEGILYMDSRRRMDGLKRAYGYVYDLRIQKRGEIL